MRRLKSHSEDSSDVPEFVLPSPKRVRWGTSSGIPSRTSCELLAPPVGGGWTRVFRPGCDDTRMKTFQGIMSGTRDLLIHLVGSLKVAKALRYTLVLPRLMFSHVVLVSL